ncbi:MAG TPA: ABC transporter permease [Stellaceae bacterium]|nr:ABC transporter permease [Stellaceae bacterium]
MKSAPDAAAAVEIGSAAPDGEADYDRRRARRSRKARLVFLADRALAIVLPLVGWQLLADHWSGGKWISSPLAVVERLASMAGDGSLQMHTWQTLDEALIGLLVGLALGIAIGVALGLSKRLSDAVDPIVMGFYSLPRVSLAPLFIIWLGIGLLAKVALVASVVLFVVLFNVREGVRNVDREIVEAFRSMNASRGTLVRYVVIPSLVPWIFASIRIGIGMALIGAVVAELIGSSRGLGWYVMHSTGVYDMTGSITALVVLMILAIIFNWGLGVVERRMLRWRRGSEVGIGP